MAWLKRNYITLILVIILLIGLGLLLYPTVSDYWNSLHQSRVIVGYQKSVADMEKDLLDFLSNAITEHAADPVRIIERACEYMESHLEFVRLIINNNVDPLFPQKLFSQAAVREAAQAKYTARQDPAGLEYYTNFIIYGAYRVICVWLNRDDRESPQQIARQLIRFIQME